MFVERFRDGGTGHRSSQGERGMKPGIIRRFRKVQLTHEKKKKVLLGALLGSGGGKREKNMTIICSHDRLRMGTPTD